MPAMMRYFGIALYDNQPVVGSAADILSCLLTLLGSKKISEENIFFPFSLCLKGNPGLFDTVMAGITSVCFMPRELLKLGSVISKI